MKKAYQIHIKSDWCKGCNLCVEICPKKVFLMSDQPLPSGYFIARIAQVSLCTGCLECELHCPDLAIEVISKQ